jgi:hypothetical protein
VLLLLRFFQVLLISWISVALLNRTFFIGASVDTHTQQQQRQQQQQQRYWRVTTLAVAARRGAIGRARDLMDYLVFIY